jgi:DNA-binding GntR family transcriptional regulator
LKNDLVERIRLDLIAGRLRSGEWLRLNELEQRYGASRFEVRQALGVLSTLNALEHVENRGYRVHVADPEKNAYHREVRLVLELSTAARVMATATPADTKHLRRLAKQFEWSIENGTIGEVEMANHAFHRAFFALCGNPIMADTINNLRELIYPFSRDPWATVADRRKSARDHFDMVDALERKDLEELRQLMRSHLGRKEDDAVRTNRLLADLE